MLLYIFLNITFIIIYLIKRVFKQYIFSCVKLMIIADSSYFCPSEKIIDWILPYTQYQNQLVDQAALMLTLSGRVSETQQVLANQTSFRLRTPDIHIEVRHPEPSAAF